MSEIEVRYGASTEFVPRGTVLSELLATKDREFVAALLNNRLVSLDTQIYHPVEVIPVVRESAHAQSLLIRSVLLVFYTSLFRLYPGLRVEIGQALPTGYFHSVRGIEFLSKSLSEVAEETTSLCLELIKRDVTFVSEQIPVEGVPSRVPDPFGYRERLLRTWSKPLVPFVSLDGFTAMQHGPYVPSTGYLDPVQVRVDEGGLTLEWKPEKEDARRSKILLRSYAETREWNRRLSVGTVGDLNAAILDGRVSEVVRVAEAFHEKKIAHMSDAICARRDEVKMICVAGPSSAGKTTFVRRLRVHLLVNGLEPLYLSLDSYYRPRSEQPLGDDGQRDYEALGALDVELLGQHLQELCQGKEVAVPAFDFRDGVRTPEHTWKSLRVKRGQVLMVEGLHGLNPALCSELTRESRYLIFVNALTQLVIDEHNRLSTSKIRLLRRIVRDRRFRGCSAAETLAMWPKVRQGEERHIFPFQAEADALFNSSLVYEAAVLRNLAWRFLLEVPRSDPMYCEAYQLLMFLELFVPVEEQLVPSNSVLREFMGGSLFEY